jgi:DNA-binding LacI/PurR family transcriptional regulator
VGSHHIFPLDDGIDTYNYVAKQRLLGCWEAIARTQIMLGSVLVCEATICEEGGAEAARRLLQRQPETTAIICFSDPLAYGAMAECKRLGLDVPQRISVTGFDDVEPRGLHPSFPSLTTVKQDAYEKGRKAAEALLYRGGEHGRRSEIEAITIISDSTARVRAT